MAEYIEKEKAARILREEAAAHYPTAFHVGLYAAARAIDSIPAADVRPVVKSKWDDKRVSFYRGCPKCGAFVSADLDEVFLRDFPSAVGKLNFCPNCGADMREES